jgi:hypothetical protein
LNPHPFDNSSAHSTTSKGDPTVASSSLTKKKLPGKRSKVPASEKPYEPLPGTLQSKSARKHARHVMLTNDHLRNICGREWKVNNVNGSKGEFEAYYKSLSTNAIQVRRHDYLTILHLLTLFWNDDSHLKIKKNSLYTLFLFNSFIRADFMICTQKKQQKASVRA